MTLLARVDLKPDELTQVSFVSRVAAVNGCSNPAQFCRETGLNWTLVRKGERQTLQQLAALSGADTKLLERNAIVEVGRRSFEIRGCHAVSNMFRTDEYALCKHCIANDLKNGSGHFPFDGVYLRIPWHLRAIETCALHESPLVTFPLSGIRYDKRDFAAFGWDSAFALAETETAPGTQPASSFELYLLGRLNGLATSTWLDEMPMSEVVRLCEAFGSAIVFGEFRRRKHRAELESRRCLQEGFELLRHGPDAIQSFLSDRRERLQANGTATGLPELIGPAVELLTPRENETTPFFHFRREMKRFSDTHLQGERMKSRFPQAAAPYSSADIAERAGVSLETLRRAMTRLSLDAGEAVHFDALTARRIAKEAKRLWTNREARAVLDVSHDVLWRLADEGLLGTVHRGDGFKANRLFEPASVEMLIEKVRSAVASAVATAGTPCWISLTQATMRYRTSIDVLIEMILDRTLINVRFDGNERGIAAVRICDHELCRQLLGVDWYGISLRQTACQLDTSFEVTAALVKGGHLTAKKLVTSSGATVFVSEDSVRRFQSHYISLSTLASQHGRSPASARKYLSQRGILPAIPRDQCGANYFEREQVPPTF